MPRQSKAHQVFVSHSSVDTWVAKQIASHVERSGAASFLDAADIDHGDDFDERIVEAADCSQELLVLLTPWAKDRPYVWMEIGMFRGRKKRVVGVLHGLKATEDAPTAKVLASELNKSGVSVWFDQKELKAGEDWSSAIEKSLASSKVAVMLVSDASLRSQSANYEMGLALGKAGDTDFQVIPILMNDTDVQSLPAPMRNRQFLAFGDTKNDVRRLASFCRKTHDFFSSSSSPSKKMLTFQGGGS